MALPSLGLPALPSIAAPTFGAPAVSSIAITPWTNINDPFFQAQDIIAGRWSSVYPYRLLVVDASNGYRIVTAGGGTTNFNSVTVKTKDTGGFEFGISSESNSWLFTLPITPQQISVTDTYSIVNTPTLKGIVEEHSGTRYKMINIQGSFGVWPGRKLITPIPSSPNVLQSLGASTLQALSGIGASLDKFTNAISGNYPIPKPVSVDPISIDGGVNTGYYFAQRLSTFLEQYTIAKKNPHNVGWRLVFDYPKENQSFIVTPLSYTSSKSQTKPGEYMFSLQLKSWKRIDLETFINLNTPTVTPLDSNFFLSALAAISAARTLIASSMNLIQAVQSDFLRPLNALRQLSLVMKGLVGLSAAVADLPRQLIADVKATVQAFVSTITDIVATFGAVTKNLAKLLNANTYSTSSNEGVAASAVQGGALGPSAHSQNLIDPTVKYFAAPETNYQFFNGIQVSDITLTPQQQVLVDNELQQIADFRTEDIANIRNLVQSLATNIANNLGASDTTFAAIYGTSTPIIRAVPITIDDTQLLEALYNVLQITDTLTANKNFDNIQQTNQSGYANPMQYVGILASDSNVPFTVSISKILRPIPFGLTIEQISARYLQDANRWIEIVALNDLRSPYIDEDGFILPFLSNGDGRQFTILDGSNLFVGQQIILSSTLIPRQTRNIIKIEELSGTVYLITVDGEGDLQNLLLANNAQIQAYLPGTLNSQNQIYIPSDLPASPDNNTFPIANLLDPDKLTGLSQIDLLLTDAGDLALNGLGDFRYSNGLTNLIQALKLKIITRNGDLFNHPTFGLGLRPGIMTSDISNNLKEILNDFQKMIAEDPRFQNVENMSITLSGPTLYVSLDVRLPSGLGVLPVSFGI